MRRLGVSNDLRDRGDEWPLLRVVKGLSVVVATVVDEVSIVLAALRPPLRFFGPSLDYLAAGSSLPASARGGLRGAANVSEHCAIA